MAVLDFQCGRFGLTYGHFWLWPFWFVAVLDVIRLITATVTALDNAHVSYPTSKLQFLMSNHSLAILCGDGGIFTVGCLTSRHCRK